MQELLEKEIYKFSVVIPVCDKVKNDDLCAAIDSILNQTLMPNEVLITTNTYFLQPVSADLDKYKSKYPEIFNIVLLDKQINLGQALRIGVEKAQNPIVAIMKSDDISDSSRFEKQIAYLKEHPDVDVLGSWIAEFDGNIDNIYAKREVPIEHSEIYNFSKFRNPINHTTVMFKKASVMRAANYTCRKKMADYSLWVTMLYQGCKFANIPECLVNVRAGKDYIKHLSGQNKNFLYEYGVFERFFESGFIGFGQFFKAVILRFIFRISPSSLRVFIHNNFLCKKITANKKGK